MRNSNFSLQTVITARRDTDLSCLKRKIGGKYGVLDIRPGGTRSVSLRAANNCTPSAKTSENLHRVQSFDAQQTQAALHHVARQRDQCQARTLDSGRRRRFFDDGTIAEKRREFAGQFIQIIA